MATKAPHLLLAQALEILDALQMPRAQCNERSALCLLAVLDLSPGKSWRQSTNPRLGITPIMDWMRLHFKKDYKPNTRETIRRQTMHQFIEAGLVMYNPDLPSRPVNSPHAVYQISPAALVLLREFGTRRWHTELAAFNAAQPSLAKQYAQERDMARIPIRFKIGDEIQMSPGAHSELIKAILEEFAPRFVPDCEPLYVGDTGAKQAYFKRERAAELGIQVGDHGKMPDVILYYPVKNWLILVESVTSHGPVDGKRHRELETLFASASAGLVYVTAFPSRKVMAKYVSNISWETEVWCAEAPTHLIHFNGARFLGPYPSPA